MARSTAEIELLVIVEKATKAVEDFAKTTQKQLSGISFNSTVSAINSGLELIDKTAGRAFGNIKDFISDSIKEASAAEDAIVKLSNALRIQNDFSQESIEGFKQFASALQSTTTFSDEAILNSIALSKEFKATNEEAKRITKTAADLAAVTGRDLNDATFAVAQTLNGFVDKGLAKAIPELRSLTKEALISGAAIDIIGKRFEGSAEALGNTFSGALTKAKNSFSDLLEVVGGFIVNNPVIISGLNEIKKAFDTLGRELEKNKESITGVVTEGFLFLIESAPAIINAIQFIDKVVSNTVVTFYTLGRSIGAVAAAIVELSKLNFDGIKEINKAVTEENASAFATNAKRLESLYEPAIKTAQDLASKIREVSTENKKLFKDQVGKSLSGKQERIKLAIDPQDVKKKIEEATKNPIKALVDLKFNFDTKTGAAIGVGFVDAVLKGAKGAQQLVGQLSAAIGDAVIPGIGGAVQSIVDVLGQGPDKVRQTVREFAKSLPEIIKAITDSLPVLIEELAKELPPALAKSMPFVAEKFAFSLVSNMPTIVRGFAEGLVNAAKQFVQELINNIKSLGGVLGGGNGGLFGTISGSGGNGVFSGIPILGGIGDLLGFADGGRVPNSPRFSNDRFPARLSAGEQVLNSDLTDKLDKFLSQSNSGQPLVVNLVVGQQQLARAILDLNRGGFRTV